MDLTPLARIFLRKISKRTETWKHSAQSIQTDVLKSLLGRAQRCETGRHFGFKDILASRDLYKSFTESVSDTGYEEIRSQVMRMIQGERNILWPGICRNFAQSSGTSGGKSKYIPITGDSLARCHYPGTRLCVAGYLAANPRSRLFSGKALVLGGSFAHELPVTDPRVKIGDLSATLIDKIPSAANIFRVPDKNTALLPDWNKKLPLLASKAARQPITNISGVPSWFLTLIRRIMESEGKTKISDVWPGLEVFFHGGINFTPYREIYESICDRNRMHFVDTYNASEGFFAAQNDFDDPAMLLFIDNDIFYEFIDLSDPSGTIVPLWEVQKDHVYELLITSSNGLWRYRIGDTVKVHSLNPVKVTVAGRTKTFINAFGEELMEHNAEQAMAKAAARTGAVIANYTAAPVYATATAKGHHQWLVEWHKAPASLRDFSRELDKALRRLNSDYDAKRTGTIFLDPPEVTTLPEGSFSKWLRSTGTGKLGGQRKVPRLSNDRNTVDAILAAVNLQS